MSDFFTILITFHIKGNITQQQLCEKVKINQATKFSQDFWE